MSCTVKNGTDIGIYVGATLIALGTSHDFEVAMETRDTSTKDSAGWKESCEAQRSWSMSGEFLFSESAAYGFDDLFAIYVARSTETIKISSGTSGEKEYSGDAFLTALSKSAPNEDSVSFSASFEGTGVLAETTIS